MPLSPSHDMMYSNELREKKYLVDLCTFELIFTGGVREKYEIASAGLRLGEDEMVPR